MPSRCFTWQTAISIFCAFGLLISGTIQTIFLKLQDESFAKGVGTLPPHRFDHPTLQTFAMFIAHFIVFPSAVIHECILQRRLRHRNAQVVELLQKLKECPGTSDLRGLPLFSCNSESDDVRKIEPPLDYREIETDDEDDSSSEDSCETKDEVEYVAAAGPRVRFALPAAEGDEKAEEDSPLLKRKRSVRWGKFEVTEVRERQAWLVVLKCFIPAMLDLSATTLMNYGLLLTFASVYQMMRGTSTVFTCFLTIFLLLSPRFPHHWVAVCAIALGLFFVGLFSFISIHASEAESPFLGALLVLVAQVFTSLQYVVEEWLFVQPQKAMIWDAKLGKEMPDPLLAPSVLTVLASEGLWGLCVTSGVVSLKPVLFSKTNQDLPADAMLQMVHNPAILGFVIAATLTIAVYNIFGIWVTAKLSAVARTTINSTRTILVWGVQLARGKEHFSALQLVGFLIIVFGTFLYNDVIPICCYFPWYRRKREAVLDAKAKEKRCCKKLQYAIWPFVKEVKEGVKEDSAAEDEKKEEEKEEEKKNIL